MASDDRTKKEELSEADEYTEGKFHEGFVSGWDDDSEEFEEEEAPQETPEKKILWAAENGNTQLASELLAADSNLVRVTDKDGYTPLHRAAYNNHLEVLNILLEYGADINSETTDKWTPLHSACRWNSTACVEKLISLDINVNTQSEGGITPLHLASSTQCAKTVQALLMHPNIDVKMRNDSDETAYEIAFRKGKLGKYFEIAEPCFNFI